MRFRPELKTRFIVWVGAALLLFAAGCAKHGDPARGRQVFNSTCDACHAASSQVNRGGPGLAGLYKREKLPNGNAINDRNVDQWIRNGNQHMLGYKNQISEEQMRNLIAYLRTL
jgi:mono/diheme cytochrome c family protein